MVAYMHACTCVCLNVGMCVFVCRVMLRCGPVGVQIVMCLLTRVMVLETWFLICSGVLGIHVIHCFRRVTCAVCADARVIGCVDAEPEADMQCAGLFCADEVMHVC